MHREPADSAAGRILMVGLGSPHGDDQLGWLVAAQLQQRLRESAGTTVDVVEVRRAAVPLDLLDWLEQVRQLHVCDACQRTDGTLDRVPPREPVVHRLPWSHGVADQPQPTALSTTVLSRLRCQGTHDFGLVQTLQLAERVGRLPSQVTVWAVEGQAFAPGEPLSANWQDCVNVAVDRLLTELWHA